MVKFMDILNWKITASGMLLANGGGFTYTIWRPGGDSGFWTLGRTSADEGVMLPLGKRFVSEEDAKMAAEEDYQGQEE